MKIKFYTTKMYVNSYFNVNEDEHIYNPNTERIRLNLPENAAYLAKHIMKMDKYDKEVISCIALDSRLQLINITKISEGTANASLLQPRDLFKSLVLSNAVSFIILHNHPSGDPNPSNHDFEITDMIEKAGITMNIKMNDHIIIGNKSAYSFALARTIDIPNKRKHKEAIK